MEQTIKRLRFKPIKTKDMILVEKKVIEELSVLNVNNIRVINVQTLLENSKEVEVVDMDKILKQYNEQLSPYYAAARLWVDGVIDPAETRKIVSMGIEAANHAPITERYNVGVIQT